MIAPDGNTLQSVADLRTARDEEQIAFRLAKAATVEFEAAQVARQLVRKTVLDEVWACRMAVLCAPWAAVSKTVARRAVRSRHDVRKIGTLLRAAIHDALNDIATTLDRMAESPSEREKG